jgi:SpoVK/Ycf46/Vps4 family AAA+-type ATPase
MNVSGKPVSYQRPVYDELREIAADFYDYDWSSLPIAPRTNVLVVGSTGGGKTFLCRRLAAELGLPLLDVEYANWVVTGAGTRGGMHTLRLIYTFVQRYARGIIALDEVDKIGTDQASDWTRSVHLEVFALLDKRVLSGVIEGGDLNENSPRFRMTGEEIQARLLRGHLVIGAGAWQHLWRRVPSAGFAEVDEPASQLPTYKELVELMRPEILNRFNSKVLFLPPLSRLDYQSLVEETLRSLPENFRPIMREAALATVDQALEMQKGFRWIEELVGQAIRVLRPAASKNTLTQETAARLCSPQPTVTEEIDAAV